MQILYNDEAPDGSIMFKKGHTKGLILGNGDGGIWLVHSVPRFPPIDAGKYYFPHNGFQYGQSLLCISFDLNNLDKVGIYGSCDFNTLIFYYSVKGFLHWIEILIKLYNNSHEKDLIPIT